MSSTRTAKDSSVFHQSRYASSPEFERGLLANLVAKRCALLEDPSQRELIWFIQHLSHQDGGLAVVAKELISKYADRIQTAAMAEVGMKPGKILPLDQLNKIRTSLPWPGRFCLKGEVFEDHLGIVSVDHPRRRASEYGIDYDIEMALKNPTSFLANDFIELCQTEAVNKLEPYLRDLCLDPATDLDSGPWYFPGLIGTIREYQSHLVKARNSGAVTTALGKKVCEVLDYTFYSRGLTLMDGLTRMGKSHAARVWCDQHPGQARFIEVPPSNDEASFFRALARGLGLGNFLKYKVGEIRERVESVLLSGDLLLVLDEAQRLWPQMNIRYGFPSRINWVMMMANHKVPICAIATPQFIASQKAAEEKCQWNGAQLTGRISHYESLPSDLSPEDLMAVAKSVLPEANSQVLGALGDYARCSSRYLAAIDSISKRARYIAKLDGRATATTGDVRKAMKESVIPADTRLHRALEAGRKSKPGKLSFNPPATPLQADTQEGDMEDFQQLRDRSGQRALMPDRMSEASLSEA